MMSSEVRRSSTGTSEQAFRFTGEQQDPDVANDLYYLRARYYDPKLGRFWTQDPIPGGNLYTYGGNNPVRYVDPAGLWVHDNVGDFVSGAVGAVVDAFETGYIDVGGTYCGLWRVGCVTGGFQFGQGQGFHPYVGAGFGSPGRSLAINLYPNQTIGEGLACGLQTGAPVYLGVGVGGEVGFSGIGVGLDKESKPTFSGSFYGGGGLYVGTLGASLTCYDVFPSLGGFF